MNEISFSFAQSGDEEPIRELLKSSGLPDEDIHSHMPHFIVARSNGALIGCVALEPAAGSALLRSLVVVPEFRAQGLGQMLCERITDYARSRGFRELYLLTTTAVDFFGKRGYAQMERTEAPDGIQNTEEFRNLCPSSSTLMRKSIQEP